MTSVAAIFPPPDLPNHPRQIARPIRDNNVRRFCSVLIVSSCRHLPTSTAGHMCVRSVRAPLRCAHDQPAFVRLSAHSR